jgi:uncharacterized low-complexity protein
MKLKLITQSAAVLAAGLLMAMSSTVMAKSVQTVNPFEMGDMNASNLVMSSDHDHDKDKKAEGKCGDGKSKEKKEGKKADGKCGSDHMKENEGKCGGH